MSVVERRVVVEQELITTPDASSLAARAAEFVADRARSAVADHGRFTFAVSGGSTPWAMFAQLAHQDVPWSEIEVFQVDERVAPEGDPDRNLTHLRESLGGAPATVVAMPVNDADLDRAAAAYADRLPARFDLVHLGLGPDGHTASLVPGDPVLDVTDRMVAVTRPYQGHPRMTLTYPALARADDLMWLIAGADKQQPLSKLLAHDPSIPAGRVEARHSTILADAAAYPFPPSTGPGW
jgi:6-phosphogluconolactonase